MRRREEKKMDKINVVIKEPGKAAREIELENTHERLQELVGGHIESVWFAKNVWMIVNEEGKIRYLPFNFYLWDDVIVGPAIFAGQDGDELADCPVSAETIERILGNGDENGQG